MASRLELQTLLESILPEYQGQDDTHVYFQPPASVSMKYPAIKYGLKGIEIDHANDNPYIQSRSYEITLIDEDPDSLIVDKVLAIPMCRFDRRFTADNLNHTAFVLYF